MYQKVIVFEVSKSPTLVGYLESRGLKNIRIYLLDTILQDDYSRKLNSMISQDEVINELQEIGLKEGYTRAYIDRVISAIDPEKRISNDSLVSNIVYSNVTLLKAMKIEEGKEEDELYKYLNSLENNNLERYVSKFDLLKIDADHRSIMTKLLEEWDKYKPIFLI